MREIDTDEFGGFEALDVPSVEVFVSYESQELNVVFRAFLVMDRGKALCRDL